MIQVSIPRPVTVTALGLTATVAVAWCADAVVATHAEHALSSAVAHNSRLEVAPNVYLAGLPYLQAVVTGKIPRLSVEALDVDTPGLGLVNARTELEAVKVTPQQVFSGDLTGAQAELATRKIGLDGVAVGAQLGMTDLDIANPYDISPKGGPAVEAQLTGTPHGFDKPVTVIVTLRLSGPQFTMEPVEFPDVPPERIVAARRAFTWTLNTRSLPLSGQAQAVFVTGGSIYFESQARTITVDSADLSPLETARKSDFDSTDYGRG
ncbi:LmeA family phospholipid-binding protein [Corynebacterium uberis]|uniref:LmeA family phospholipid-binding protein n=1 Tax=Corynebacterium TaxID=1716 RepID=UPI00237D008E|nr:DUF2993 domain-containing protein [Corynebacterium sp. c6VSa_13]